MPSITGGMALLTSEDFEAQEEQLMDGIADRPIADDHRIAVSPGRAAELIDMSRAGIYPLLMSGAIKSFRAGKRRFVLVSSLREWAEREAELQTGDYPTAPSVPDSAAETPAAGARRT